MGKQKTHKEYILEVAKINSNIQVIGEYINAHTKIEHKCLVCGHKWFAKPNGILLGYGCAKCAGVLRYTQKEYEAKVKEVNPNIEVLGEYINMNQKISHRCKICNHKWETKPNDIVKGHGCPVCSGKIIGNPPEYKNSIWSSEYKDYFSKYMTENQMKSYTPYSNRRAKIKCPDCGRYKEISPNTLHENGLGCICGDGVSYPNKFVYSVLNQLSIEVVIEYRPSWSNRKQYDIYIPEINCIIENHGAQHYKDGSGIFGVTYKTEKQNDDCKENLAKTNGIINYIVIDCRYSNKDWIKSSILNSELPRLLHFSINDINWDECDRFATSNFVKIASELWNNGLCPYQIKEQMNLSKNTIYNYLNKGAKLSICNYTSELSKQRTKEYKNNINLKGVC